MEQVVQTFLDKTDKVIEDMMIKFRDENLELRSMKTDFKKISKIKDLTVKRCSAVSSSNEKSGENKRRLMKKQQHHYVVGQAEHKM